MGHFGGDELQTGGRLLKSGHGDDKSEHTQGENHVAGPRPALSMDQPSQNENGNRGHHHPRLNRPASRHKHQQSENHHGQAEKAVPGRFGTPEAWKCPPDQPGGDRHHQPTMFIIILLRPGGGQPAKSGFLGGRAKSAHPHEKIEKRNHQSRHEGDDRPIGLFGITGPG